MDVMSKEDLVKVLKEHYEISEYMYDDNLTRMAQLQEQIENTKKANTEHYESYERNS